MARPASGSVIRRTRKDGLTSFSLRVTADGERRRIPLGTEEDGWTDRRAANELENTLALIRAGVWQPPSEPERLGDPTFHEYATDYLESRRGELADNTYADYLWRLSCHLLPFFAAHKLREIDVQAVDAYRQHKVAERERIKALQAAGEVVRDGRGQRVRPLSNESINKTLALLAAILDVAVDHGHLDANPARGRRRRLKTKRPRRPFLEGDEVQSLLVAAEALDRKPSQVSAMAAEAQRLRDVDGLTYPELADALGVSLSHAHYLYGRATRDAPEPILMRRAIIAVLAGTGLRVSELAALRWRDVDLLHRRISVPDAKTPAGVREVRLTPWVVTELERLRTVLRADGFPIVGNHPVFPTSKGTFRDRKNICDRVVKRAVALADREREAQGLHPMPEGVTPHALRCTYISMMFEAGAPLPYVMAQVGHVDESTTLGIYARVLRRRSRTELDQSFDAVVGSGEPEAVFAAAA